MGALRGDPRRRVPRGLACHSQAPLAPPQVGRVQFRTRHAVPKVPQGLQRHEVRAQVRNRTGSSRLRGGCSTIRASWANRSRCAWVRAGASGRRAPAEGIEPSSSRLTAGCLTIRRRWNVSLDAHEHAAADSACPSSRGRRNGEAVSTHVRVERKVGAEFSENRAACERIRTQIRAQGSNLSSWVQSPVSLPTRRSRNE